MPHSGELQASDGDSEENKLMHTSNAMWLTMLAAVAGTLSAQAPQTGGGAQAPAYAAAAQTAASAPQQAATAADLLQPALSDVRSTLSSLNLEKWKKGTVREEAEENVNALERDLDGNIQPMITAADAAPAQLSKAIPLVKHLDAFYDVLLRVEEASRVAAPAEQIDALQRTLLRVSQARNAYDDALQTQAASVEKQMGDLQTAVRAEQQNVKDAQHQVELAKAAEKAVPCKPATPVHRRRRTTAAKKPPQTQQPAKTPQTQPPAQKPQ
jgi:chromosome segregation ATPase